jgi:hypothetical protein
MLSEYRRSRDERKSKHPDNLSSTMPIRGVLFEIILM